MKKHLLKAFFRINKYSVLLTFTLTFIIQNFIIESGERMRNCYMPLFTEILLSALSFFISLASITIFLNLFKRIIQNNILILLSFILLPLINSIIIIFYLVDENDSYLFLYISVLLFPVWTFIIREYFKFSRIEKKLEN